MKCPRCQAGIEPKPDPAGFMVCPGCGARLRRTSAQVAQAVPASVQAGSMTLPPSDSPLGPRRVGPKPAAPEAGKAPPAPPRRVGDDTARVAKAASAAAIAAPFTAPAANTPATASAVDAVLAEVRAVRRVQEDILEMLRARTNDGSAPPPRPGNDDFEGLREPVVRSSRRKRVLLVD